MHRPESPILATHSPLAAVGSAAARDSATPAAAVEHAGSRDAWPHEGHALDVLVVSTQPLWPLDRDGRGFGCRAARALKQQGYRVAITSVAPTPRSAQAWLVEMLVDWPEADGRQVGRFLAGWSGVGKDLRYRAAVRLRLSAARLAGVVALIDRYEPAAVIAIGPAGPALLAGAKGADPSLHTAWLGPDAPTLTAMRQAIDLRTNQRPAAIARGLGDLLQSAAFAGSADRVIGMTRGDTWVMRLSTLSRHAVTMPRGVNLHRYFPAKEPIRPRTAVTWAPDLSDPALVEAMTRFARHLWPRLREHFPDARWRIIGPHAPRALQKLQRIDGIKFVGPLADVRRYARRCRLALFPTRHAPAAGKPLIEALALGLPIVGGARAARSLGVPGAARPTREAAMFACRGRQQWFEAVARLWSDPALAAQYSENARGWAVQHADRREQAHGLQALLGLPDRHAMSSRTQPASPATAARQLTGPIEPTPGTGYDHADPRLGPRPLRGVPLRRAA